jgi:hypothetical protein
MNPSEVEPSREIGFLCGSCNRFKDDVFILRDGSVVCGDCVDLWERDREKQNRTGIMARHDTKTAEDMKQQGIRPTSTPAEVIDAWDKAVHPMRG